MGKTIDVIVRECFKLLDKFPTMVRDHYSFDIQFTLTIEDGDYSKESSDKDAESLAWVVGELVQNAYKAVYGIHPLEGMMYRSASETMKNTGVRVTIGLVEKKDTYIISVMDNGDGIPEQNFDKVFVKGFTTRRTATSGGDYSHGFGLWKVQNKVSGLRGKINFESTVGEGTTFYVELPKD